MNSRGNYGFRFREHMEDVTESVVDNSVEMESATTNATTENTVEITDEQSIEIPPELQTPERRVVNEPENNSVVLDGELDFLKRSAESVAEKMRNFFRSRF